MSTLSLTAQVQRLLGVKISDSRLCFRVLNRVPDRVITSQFLLEGSRYVCDAYFH